MTDRSRLRLVVLGVLIISLVGTLLGRLWYLQVLNANTYKTAAISNQIHDVVTEAPRGEVLDDMGRPLIDNKTALVVSVDRAEVTDQPDGGKAELKSLGALLHIKYRALFNTIQLCGSTVNGKIIGKPCWNGSPYEPIPVSKLKPNVKSAKQALLIEELGEKYPGVTAQPAGAVRNYPEPDGAQAATVLGYTEQISQAQLDKLPEAQRKIELNSQVGTTGIEQSYDKYLRGKPGVKEVTVDHVGTVTGTVKTTAPVPGDDVVTNIDAKAQSDLETQLQNALDTAHHNGYTGDYAAGVVMNVRTGGIVAMASNPSYNPRKPPPSYTSQKKYNKVRFSAGHPFLDKAYGASGPPGSTFKMVSSSGLLNDGTMSTGGSYDCATNYDGRHSFEGEAGLGYISLRDAIIVSCDTFFFKLGEQDWTRDNNLINEHKKPREGVQNLARDYGMGENPGIDLPGANYGHIPDRRNAKLEWQENKKQYCEGAARRPKGSYQQVVDHQYCVDGYVFEPGDQENVDVGQGTVTVSPLQLAVAYSALANGGTVYKPRVVKAIYSPEGKLIKRIKAPVRDHIPLSKSDLAYLRDAFYGVTTSHTPLGTATGTFAGFPMNQVEVGGKTGTAELTGTSQNGSWFASFGGPAGQEPQYVTVIEVDKSDQGAISAAPFVRNMWQDLYGIGGSKPIFPNGVPPKKLPKVGPVAMRAKLARQKARAKAHAKALRQQGSSSSGTPGSTTTTPASPPPSSPSTNAAGLPPGLPITYRREVRP